MTRTKSRRSTDRAVGRGSTWTGGRQLGARTAGVLVWLAVGCGPLALLGVVGGLGRPTAVAASVPQQTAGLTVVEQSAGDFALGYVTSWLGASQNAPGDLGAYIDLTALRGLSEQPWVYRDAGVVSVAPQTPPFVAVVVAASVSELQQGDSSDATTTVWVRRFFQVVVATDGAGALRAIGLPSPVDAPAQGSTVPLAYAQTIAPSDPAAQAVSGFLGAYLSGSGDISRYTAPGVELAAITPAPYVKVDVIQLLGDVAPAVIPADGAVLHVLATAQVLSPLEQQLTTTTTLTLTARAGRWEISSLDAAPEKAPQYGESTTTPTPTSAG